MSFGSEIYNEVGRSLGFDPPYSFDQIKKIRECISEGFYRRNKIKEGCRWSHGEYEDVTMEDLKNLIIKHGLRERLGLAMTPREHAEEHVRELRLLDESPVVCVWQDRAVKVHEGLFWLSRRGAHDDWDIAPATFSQHSAFCGNCGSGRVEMVQVIDDENLMVVCKHGCHVMCLDGLGRIFCRKASSWEVSKVAEDLMDPKKWTMGSVFDSPIVVEAKR